MGEGRGRRVGGGGKRGSTLTFLNKFLACHLLFKVQ